MDRRTSCSWICDVVVEGYFSTKGDFLVCVNCTCQGKEWAAFEGVGPHFPQPACTYESHLKPAKTDVVVHIIGALIAPKRRTKEQDDINDTPVNLPFVPSHCFSVQSTYWYICLSSKTALLEPQTCGSRKYPLRPKPIALRYVLSDCVVSYRHFLPHSCPTKSFSRWMWHYNCNRLTVHLVRDKYRSSIRASMSD